jgi:hypothetical protein
MSVPIPPEHRSGPPAAVPSSAIGDRLARVAEVLTETHHRGATGHIVRLSGLCADSPELELVPIPAHGVYAELLGQVVSPRWEAAGVVVGGNARSLGDAHHRPGDRLGSATVALVVAREGTTASSLRIDGADPVVQVDGEADGVLGRLVDVVRRGFELPTAPPGHAVESVAAAVWLHRVHARAVEVSSVDVALVESLRPSTPDDWEAWRQQCARSMWPELGIHPELAAWMDDGMFCRTCAEAFPDPLELVVDLSDLLESSVWSHLVTALSSVDFGHPAQY